MSHGAVIEPVALESARSTYAEPSEVERVAEVIRAYLAGQVDEERFRRFRLQHGMYGIRGQKAMLMVRVKLPQGRLNAEQLERLGEIATEFSNGIGHVTTRQDIQFHWVPMDKAPAVLGRLAEVGLTTREACGNTVRNVTASPLAGVSSDELFDVTPYAEAVTRFFLRHPLCQNLPRKFKIAFSGGAEDHSFTAIHDIGAVAALGEVEGRARPGFRLYVGGGLGPVPRPAELLEDFTPATDLVLTCAAVIRVFDRHGNRKDRNRARLKFLIEQIGMAEFRRLVLAEREALIAVWPEEFPRVEAAAVAAPAGTGGEGLARDEPLGSAPTPIPPGNAIFQRWFSTNVVAQKQPGYYAVYVTLPSGDVTADQFKALAALARRFAGGELRTTPTQNLVFRWVSADRLAALHSELVLAGLGAPGAHRIGNVVGCPGADTCNIAITASHRLSLELTRQLAARRDLIFAEDLVGATIKVSGCPNSCGHHHIATIGLYGAARKIGERQVPHYQLLLGGEIGIGHVRFGRPVLRLPARRVPDALFRLIEHYRAERAAGETFVDWARRITSGEADAGDGEALRRVRAALAPFQALPPYEAAPDEYNDWGQTQEFMVQVGRGECAS